MQNQESNCFAGLEYQVDSLLHQLQVLQFENERLKNQRDAAMAQKQQAAERINVLVTKLKSKIV